MKFLFRKRILEPQFQSVSVHSIEVVLVQILVSHKAQVLVETKSRLVGHFCLQDNLCIGKIRLIMCFLTGELYIAWCSPSFDSKLHGLGTSLVSVWDSVQHVNFRRIQYYSQWLNYM